MKRLLLLSICFCLCLLSGCDKAPAKETPTSSPILELPLTDEELEQPVPDFLGEDLQQLYRRARNVYDHLFIETVGCEYRDTFQPGTFPDVPEETFEEQGVSYRYASGPYQSWADLDALVHRVFTDRLFQELNAMGGQDTPLYLERDGRLCFLDLIRPNPNTRNPYFEDTFTLLEQGEDTIRFQVTGYYSFLYPREGESGSQREERLRGGYEYTESFELVLRKTGDGWRFDTFYDTAVDAGPYPERAD